MEKKDRKISKELNEKITEIVNDAAAPSPPLTMPGMSPREAASDEMTRAHRTN